MELLKKTTLALMLLCMTTLHALVPDFGALSHQYASQYPFEHQLFAAAAQGDYNKIYNLITYSRVNPRACNDFALVCAAHYGHTHIITQLLNYGLYINTYDGAPLCEASRNGHLNAVDYLLRNNANVHESFDYALACACWNGHTVVAKKLLDWGAAIHADNDAALRWACLNGHSQTVKMLLRHGADPAANNYEALYNARRNGHNSVVSLLDNYETFGTWSLLF